MYMRRYRSYIILTAILTHGFVTDIMSTTFCYLRSGPASKGLNFRICLIQITKKTCDDPVAFSLCFYQFTEMEIDNN